MEYFLTCEQYLYFSPHCFLMPTLGDDSARSYYNPFDGGEPL